MMYPLNTDELRKVWPPSERIVTHSDDCVKWHYSCAIHRLCHELDEERKKSAAYYGIARDQLINSSNDEDDAC